MAVLLPKNIDCFDKISKKITNNQKTLKHIGILNLMPLKLQSEQDWALILSELTNDFQVDFFKLSSYQPKNTPKEYLEKNYKELNEKNFPDYLIITGAPIEKMDFSDVNYWKEIIKTLDFCKKNQIKSVFICWAASAALHHYYNIEKIVKQKKYFGFFPEIQGSFHIPVSRFCYSNPKKIIQKKQLEIIKETCDTGISIVRDKENPFLYIFDHYEYPKNRLFEEDQRDQKANEIFIPTKRYSDKNWQNYLKNLLNKFFE